MSEWRNRIVGEGEEQPDQLLANPFNWRIHPLAQQRALDGILQEVGWVQRVIVNRRTQHVVDGHARIALAISRGEKSIPVIYVDISEQEELLVLAALDPIAALAATDQAKLDEILRDVSTDNEGLSELLAELSKAQSFQPAPEDEQPHQTAKAKTVCPACGHEF